MIGRSLCGRRAWTWVRSRGRDYHRGGRHTTRYLLHSRKKIAKMACFNKAVQLHCIYKPSWCVPLNMLNVQLQAEKVCYTSTWLVLKHGVDVMTHYLDVKIHTVHCSKSAFNSYSGNSNGLDFGCKCTQSQKNCNINSLIFPWVQVRVMWPAALRNLHTDFLDNCLQHPHADFSWPQVICPDPGPQEKFMK